MITKIKEIATESPVQEIWKNLRFFLHVDSVAEAIIEFHKGIPATQRANVEKQAEQLAYCIRQAEEYFHASSQVDLPTRPNLLYYGAVSLSRALVLLRKNGEHSFDALRKSGKHNHHGLILEKTFKSMKLEGPDSFLNAIRSTINLHPQPPRIPWGHFPLFYDSLVPPAYATEENTQKHNLTNYSRHRLIDTVAKTTTEKKSLDLTRTFNALDLLKTLPDLWAILNHLHMQPMLCEGASHVSKTLQITTDEAGNEQIVNSRIDEHFFIDNVPLAQSVELAKLYRDRNPRLGVDDSLSSHLQVTRVQDSQMIEAPKDTGYIPNLVPAISGKNYYIIDPDSYVIEPASLFILLFSFSMLARYHPDIWMPAIENVQIAELADSLFNVCYRKFPHLLLDQLTFTHHVLRAK